MLKITNTTAISRDFKSRRTIWSHDAIYKYYIYIYEYTHKYTHECSYYITKKNNYYFFSGLTKNFGIH